MAPRRDQSRGLKSQLIRTNCGFEATQTYLKSSEFKLNKKTIKPTIFFAKNVLYWLRLELKFKVF